MIAPENFLEAFPEFSGIPMPALTFQLGLAVDLNQGRRWGKMSDRAAFLLAAHRLALRYDLTTGMENSGLSTTAGASGVASSVTAGNTSLSQTMAQTALLTGDNAFAADLARTAYGLEYLALMDAWLPGAEVVY